MTLLKTRSTRHKAGRQAAQATSDEAQPAGSILIDERATPSADHGSPRADTAENVAEAKGTDDESVAEAGAEAKQGFFARRRMIRQMAGTFETHPHLLALKPKEKYVFRSDYLVVDQSVMCVLAFVHDDAAHDNFGAFWGVNRIPAGLGDDVTTVVLEQVRRMDDAWVEKYLKTSEKLDQMDGREAEESGTKASRRKSAKASGDLEVINAEIQDGASYLSVQGRILVKAPDLPTLDEAVERLARLYVDRFGTLRAAPYTGEQRQELTGLLRANAKKRGRGFHYTSAEFAGSYSLVTGGLNDEGGEYVGYMVGDVNNSAVLLDVDGYAERVVVAGRGVDQNMGRAHVSDLWASKISQACLLNDRRVVHLVLDGADLDRIGPVLDTITARVDLNHGDVNMFEMFGEADDELAVYAAQMEKLKLMFEQLHTSSDGAVESIIKGALEDAATNFYIDQKMWRYNAKDSRQNLRVVGVPHRDVPRLQMFSAYLETEYQSLAAASEADHDQVRAYNVLRTIANSMLSTNGDLFNNATSDAIDGVRDARRVIYDFSGLLRRGTGIAMAQLVNIVGFAVGALGEGDTVIIHGSENVDERVKGYLTMQFDHLTHRGGRVAFCYNDVDKMLADENFNRFDMADYTILGSMRQASLDRYQELLHRRIPPDLAQLICQGGDRLSYLRRGFTNVVFATDLILGVGADSTYEGREGSR